MINYQIEHQLKAIGQRLDVRPAAEIGPHFAIIHDSKAIIG